MVRNVKESKLHGGDDYIWESAEIDNGVNVAPTRYEFQDGDGPTVVIERYVGFAHISGEPSTKWLITQPETAKLAHSAYVRSRPEFASVADAFAAAADLAKVLARLARRRNRSDEIVVAWSERHG